MRNIKRLFWIYFDVHHQLIRYYFTRITLFLMTIHHFYIGNLVHSATCFDILYFQNFSPRVLSSVMLTPLTQTNLLYLTLLGLHVEKILFWGDDQVAQWALIAKFLEIKENYEIFLGKMLRKRLVCILLVATHHS